MRFEDDLTGLASGHIRRYPAIGGQPLAWPPQHGAGPRPWAAAVSGLAEAASLKQIAAALPEGDARSRLEARAARSIDEILDHWCGTRRRWLWPGAPSAAIAIAADVAALANSHQAGFLRDELLHIAGQALLRPFGSLPPGGPAHKGGRLEHKAPPPSSRHPTTGPDQ
jgi:hypothetical protein